MQQQMIVFVFTLRCQSHHLLVVDGNILGLQYILLKGSPKLYLQKINIDWVHLEWLCVVNIS